MIRNQVQAFFEYMVGQNNHSTWEKTMSYDEIFVARGFFWRVETL